MTYDASRTTISELIGSQTNSQLRIPYYQRGFSWEKEHIEAFLSDIFSFAEKRVDAREDEYFLGPIVIMSGPVLGGYNYIIDGQQRIATTHIVLSSIRDAAHDLGMEIPEALEFAEIIQDSAFTSHGSGGGLRSPLRLGDLDQRYFESAIQKYPRHAQLVPPNASGGRIKKARNACDQKIVGALKSHEKPLAYLKTLYSALMNHTVLISIEVKNDRQAMDVFERVNCRGVTLADADLMLHRIMSRCGTQDGRKQIRKTWDEIGSRLGTTVPIQVFLRHMWSAKLGDCGSRKFYELASEYIGELPTDASQFIDECLVFCREYIQLLSQQSPNLHHSSRDAVWAVGKELDAKDALPLLLGALHRLRKTSEFSRVATAVEALVVRHKVFADRDPAELKSVLMAACCEIWTQGSDDEVADRVISKLRKIDPTANELRLGVRNARKFSSRIAKYVLREIQNHKVAGAYKATATLEHIFPRKPSQGYSPNRRRLLKPFLNHIGNLTLLTDNDNKKASNRVYGDKKKLIYANAELEIAREVASYNQWGPTSIRKRAEKLATAASRRWIVG